MIKASLFGAFCFLKHTYMARISNCLTNLSLHAGLAISQKPALKKAYGFSADTLGLNGKTRRMRRCSRGEELCDAPAESKDKPLWGDLQEIKKAAHPPCAVAHTRTHVPHT
jgi:hypothetical protein